MLIDTLSLQEANASSEIENIVTTQDELFRASVSKEGRLLGAAKEVVRYRDALRLGYSQMRETQGLITNNTIVEMFQLLKGRTDGFRTQMGTELQNEVTGETVYVPPQPADDIPALMAGLERYINDSQLGDTDPLIKMALIHHQFESIHPFSDGNGRIGRIINVLYLTKVGLLDIPILYLSRFINTRKDDYYRLLQAVRDQEAWEEWVLYILQGIAETSKSTLHLIDEIRVLMARYKSGLRALPNNIYSQDLINNLFRHPYTRIDIVAADLSVSRQTAAKYLDILVDARLLSKLKSGRQNYYVNDALVTLLVDVSGG